MASSSLTHNAHDTNFGFRVFYGKPRLHQDWNDEQVHRQVTWTELFFDLFYVVASINLGHLVSKNNVWLGAAHMLLYYMLFWFMWSAHTMFTTRIKLPGLLFDIWQLLFMLAIFGMVITCSDVAYHRRFSVALTIAKLLISLAYAVASLTIPRARQFAAVIAGQHMVCVVLALISVFTSKESFYGLMVGVLLVDKLYLQILMVFRVLHLPLHVDHVSERFGLIMIIFLGESIVGLGQQKPGDSAEHWLMLIFGVVVVWNLHFIYYHVHPGQHFHAMRIHRYRGMAWSFAHAALGFFFLCLGAGLRLTAESYVPYTSGGGHRRSLLAGGGEDKPNSGAYEMAKEGTQEAAKSYYDSKHNERGILGTDVAWLLCLSYAISLHAFYFIRALHFMDFSPDYWWNASLSENNLQWVAKTWWSFGFLWPIPMYFLAFSYEDLHGAWVLAVLAAHGLMFITVETMFTNLLVNHEALQVTLSKALHKVESERSLKRMTMVQSSMAQSSMEQTSKGGVGEKGFVFGKLGDEEGQNGQLA